MLPLRLEQQVGGFLPRDPSFAAAISAAKIRVPTLHIYGQADTLVRGGSVVILFTKSILG
jgi:pimeloyl-ACP methyl ester carboxylesterase